jgi:hypothetical protein
LYDEAGAIMTTCFVLITPDRNAGLWYDVPHVAVELHTLPTMCQGAPTVAPNSIGKSLYRAVGPEELADIGASGGRYRVPVGGTEGKYFFETPEQASNFAKMMGDKPYTTTRVTVSPSELGNGQFIHPVGEGPGYFFSTPHVPSGPVTIYNHSVLP